MSTSRPFVAPHLGDEGVAGQRRRKRQPTSRLPRRALSLVRQRLFLGATLMAGLTLGNGALWLLTQPSLRVPPRLGDVLGLMLFALVLDGAMLRVSRGRRLGDEAMVWRWSPSASPITCCAPSRWPSTPCGSRCYSAGSPPPSRSRARP